jgi:hypothetical protein
VKYTCYDRETLRRGRIGSVSRAAVPTLCVQWDGDVAYQRVLLSSVVDPDTASRMRSNKMKRSRRRIAK